MIIFFIIPLILVLIEGIFAASETGLVSMENMKVAAATKEKKRWGKRATVFLARPERFFSTILVYENFIIVVASTLFAHFFIHYFGNRGAAISTILLSMFSLVFGLYIPKSLALSRPQTIMKSLSDLIYYLEMLAYPIISFYAFIARGIALLFGSPGREDSIKRLDIVYAMSEYEQKTSSLAARLFDFSKRTVGDVMIPLDAVTLCERGAEYTVLGERGRRIFTRIPVYDRKPVNIIGIFNIKDYFYTGKTTLREPFFVRSSDRCMSIFTIMKQHGEHMAIIRDNKKALGIVTLEDLIEELVGEIRDER